MRILSVSVVSVTESSENDQRKMKWRGKRGMHSGETHNCKNEKSNRKTNRPMGLIFYGLQEL